MSALSFMKRQHCLRSATSALHAGRQAAFKRPGVGLIRFFLLWFVLAIGASIASPVIQPQSIELVCSTEGTVKLIVQTDDGAQELAPSHLDCPLCLLGAPPPEQAPVKHALSLPLARATQSIPSARIAASTASPLPARGPPFFPDAVHS
jgi:hypothetical protein